MHTQFRFKAHAHHSHTKTNERLAAMSNMARLYLCDWMFGLENRRKYALNQRHLAQSSLWLFCAQRSGICIVLMRFTMRKIDFANGFFYAARKKKLEFTSIALFAQWIARILQNAIGSFGAHIMSDHRTHFIRSNFVQQVPRENVEPNGERSPRKH